MKKHLFRHRSNRPLLSIAALILLISICVSCASSNLPLPTDTQPLPATTTATTPSPSATTTTATDGQTTAPVTTAPVTTEPPESDQALQMLQAVMAATPRDASYLSVYDLTADRMLYTTGETQTVYPASTTKLITILYALTVVNEDDIFTVGNEIEIAPYDSSKAWIAVDQQFTVRDLVAAMLLPSGNDAAYTLAVGCGRKIAEDNSLSAKEVLAVFMDGMNDFAAKQGLTGSHFVTPDGYHDPDHYTTLADMAKVARLAYADPLMTEIMAMPSYTAQPLNFGKALTWQNTNFLLSEESQYYYPDATGMKTGYHSDAGACLIATAERDGRTLLVLLFKGSDRNARFSEAKSVLELCFSILEA